MMMASPSITSSEISPAQCGGLIEAPLAERGIEALEGISPAQCGGLIEAMVDGVERSVVASISPAQCGGLIEAQGSLGTVAIGAQDFPRAMRGPH